MDSERFRGLPEWTTIEDIAESAVLQQLFSVRPHHLSFLQEFSTNTRALLEHNKVTQFPDKATYTLGVPIGPGAKPENTTTQLRGGWVRLKGDRVEIHREGMARIGEMLSKNQNQRSAFLN